VPVADIVEGYGVLEDGEFILPPIPPRYLMGINQRSIVDYNGPEAAGTIVVDPHAKLLYFVEDDGTARRLRTQPEVYGAFAAGIEGGLASPLGARALYLFQNGRDTHFRIHGTNDLESIGNSGSAGCIRMFNHDIIDLFDRVPDGTRVVVRTRAQSVDLEGQERANRGVILEPNIIDPELIYGDDDAEEAPDSAT